MCKLVLDVISDPNFIELIDGIEETASYVNKSEVFIEAFLNTPSKGLNETPLHFAAKYGLKDVVALLVSYPQCSRTAKNKHGQTPMEVNNYRLFKWNKNHLNFDLMIFYNLR